MSMFATLSALVGYEEEDEKDDPIVANKPFVKQVLDLRDKRPGNRQCINCKAADPTHVCFDFQTFVCISCNDIHAELGHKTAEIAHWDWTRQEIEDLSNMGNKKAAEAYLASELAATFEGEMRDFIRKAYIVRCWENQKMIVKGARRSAAGKAFAETTAAISAAAALQEASGYPPYSPCRLPGADVPATQPVWPAEAFPDTSAVTSAKPKPSVSMATLTLSGERLQKVTLVPVTAASVVTVAAITGNSTHGTSTSAGSIASGDIDTEATSGSDYGGTPNADVANQSQQPDGQTCHQVALGQSSSELASCKPESGEQVQKLGVLPLGVADAQDTYFQALVIEPTEASQPVAMPDLLDFDDFELRLSTPSLAVASLMEFEVEHVVLPDLIFTAESEATAPTVAMLRMGQVEKAHEAPDLPAVNPTSSVAKSEGSSGARGAASDPGDRLRAAVLSGRTDAIFGVFKECEAAARSAAAPQVWRTIKADERFDAFDELQATVSAPTPAIGTSNVLPVEVQMSVEADQLAMPSAPQRDEPAVVIETDPQTSVAAALPHAITSDHLNNMDADQLAQMHAMITQAVQRRQQTASAPAPDIEPQAASTPTPDIEPKAASAPAPDREPQAASSLPAVDPRSDYALAATQFGDLLGPFM